jgi:hypothetical protein
VADFHIETRAAGAVFLRAVSLPAHDWIIAHPVSGDKVLGGAIIQQPFIDDILNAIARDNLTAVRVAPMAMMRRF